MTLVTDQAPTVQSYQWQHRNSVDDIWQNIEGATNETLEANTTTKPLIRCVVTLAPAAPPARDQPPA